MALGTVLEETPLALPNLVLDGVLQPQADGIVTYGNDQTNIDVSNVAQGYGIYQQKQSKYCGSRKKKGTGKIRCLFCMDIIWRVFRHNQ